MQQRFVMLYPSMWTDEKYRGLSQDAQQMFLWTFSQPDASICGLYKCPPWDFAQALGENPRDPLSRDERAKLAVDELVAAGMVMYDPEKQHLWVVNRVKYQAYNLETGEFKPKTIHNMRKELSNMPDTPLRQAVLDKYRGVLGRASSR